MPLNNAIDNGMFQSWGARLPLPISSSFILGVDPWQAAVISLTGSFGLQIVFVLCLTQGSPKVLSLGLR